jgi:hypothetical protein
LLLAGGLITSVQAAGPNFKAGEWEMTHHMEVVGAPFAMPPMTTRKTACLTDKNYVPDSSQPGQECKVSDHQVHGDTVSWTLQCRTPEGTIDGKGKVTYHGDRYDGSMDAKMTSTGNPAQPIHYRYTMEGRRIGPCK